MKEPEGEWFGGSDENNFAAAARDAVENAETELRRRGEELPTEYDVMLRVKAHGPLSEYKVFVSPHG
jgi:hypothetical protein